jgi:hypothetical protein
MRSAFQKTTMPGKTPNENLALTFRDPPDFPDLCPECGEHFDASKLRAFWRGYQQGGQTNQGQPRSFWTNHHYNDHQPPPTDVTEDADEYGGLEDADEFEDEFGHLLADRLNEWDIEAKYVTAGHGNRPVSQPPRKLGVVYAIGAGTASGYITTINDPKSEQWGINDTYEIEVNKNEWVIVVKGHDDSRAWFTGSVHEDHEGWVPGEPPLGIRITP